LERIIAVIDVIQQMAELNAQAANMISTWTADDGRMLRAMANRPDANEYWTRTRSHLSDTPDGGKWVKDTADEFGQGFAYQLGMMAQGFGSVAGMIQEAMAAEAAAAATPAPAPKKKPAQAAPAPTPAKPAPKPVVAKPAPAPAKPGGIKFNIGGKK
jgi:hypothetical protein